jgi:hypothetical protein
MKLNVSPMNSGIVGCTFHAILAVTPVHKKIGGIEFSNSTVKGNEKLKTSTTVK